jgi:hypothetical protein
MITNRYSTLSYPRSGTELCPYSRPNEKAVWADAMRAASLLEAIRGCGPTILRRLHRAWESGESELNLGPIALRLPKSQSALFLQALEVDGYLRSFSRHWYRGMGGIPTVGFELLKKPPMAAEYLHQVGEEVASSAVQESLFPELAELGDDEGGDPSPLAKYVLG